MVEQEIKINQRQFFEIFPQPKEQKGEKISSLIKGITELKYDFKDVDVTCKEKVPFTYEMVFEKKKYQLLASSGKMVSKNLQNRFKNSWEGAKVKPVTPPDEIFAPEKTIVSDVILKKKSALPISFSQTGELMKSNEPLSSLVGVAKTLAKNEAFMVQYLVVPLKNQVQIFQKAMLQNVADEIKNGASEDLVGKGEQLFRAVGEDLNNTLTDVLDALFEQPIPKPKNAKPMTETTSNRTKLDQMASKLSGDLIKVRIRIFVKASNPTRRSELMYEVLTALKTVEGYNRFALTKLTPLKQKPQLIHRQFNHMRSIENLNLLSSKELMTLLSPPSDKLLKNTPQIRQIESEQTPLPSDFFQGIIPFGVTDPLNPRLIYQPTRNLDVFMLPKILLGPPGSGKTTYLIWYVLGLRKMKHNIFIFDYIKNSELTKEIMEALPEDAYEIWDFSDNDFISKFSLSYEESYFEWKQEDFQSRFDIADRIKDHIEQLLDALNDGQALNLSAQMKRTLGAVAKAVFVHRGQTLYNFYQVLTDYDVRMEYLKRGTEDKNAEGESILDEDDIKELIRLNETERVKNPDTNEWEEIENGKTNLRMIESISNRMYVFFKNNRIKRIAKNPVTNDFDFYRLFKQGKIVMIRTPQSVFSEEIRASIVAFLTLKIWLVKEAGKFEGVDDETPMPCPENPKRRLKDLYCTHMIYDEIHQIKP